MGKFRDFDEFRAEADKDGPTFTLYGKTHQLPASIPLALMVQAARLQAAADDPDAEIEPRVLIDLAAGVFGADTVTDWTAKGMGVDLLSELIGWLPEAYSAGSNEDADSGNS